MGNRRTVLDRGRVLARLSLIRLPAADAVSARLLAEYTAEGTRLGRPCDPLETSKLYPVLTALASTADVAATYGDSDLFTLVLEAVREYAGERLLELQQDTKK